MKNTIKVFCIALMAVFTLSAATCFNQSSGGGKSLNSASALKEYLDSQSANSPDKPIKVTMSANETMLKDISAAISSAGKYVSLNLSGSALTTIPKQAFTSCTNLTSVTIPDSVTRIEDRAFERCTSLTSVTIGNSVTRIGDYAFSNCTSLANVTIGNSVTNIGHHVFNWCSLTSVTIPDSVTEIRAGTFVQNQLTSITIGEGVELATYKDLEFTTLDPAFGFGFESVYINGGKRAGTYTRPDAKSTTWTMK